MQQSPIFNNTFSSEFKEFFIFLVQTMQNSHFEDMRKESHKQVFSGWLFNDLFGEELQLGLYSKNQESLWCYASVISQLLGDDTKGYDHLKMKQFLRFQLFQKARKS